jgi:Na+/H+-dicarboxylate symporter
MKPWQKVLLGMLLGIVFGLVAKDEAVYLKPIGDMFINAIQMLIIPLILCAIVSGITSVSDPEALGRVGMKSVAVYLATTTFAILIGITLSLVLKPGVGTFLDLESVKSVSIDTTYTKDFSFVKMFVNIIPKNIFEAMVSGNLLQIVFFSVFLGMTLAHLRKSKAVMLIDFFKNSSQVVFSMVSMIMHFAPYAAFALTAWVVSTQSISVLYSLGKLLGVMMVGMVAQYIIFGIFIYVFGKISPVPFYKKSLEYQAIALSTSSSKASLATTMKVCKERLGISNDSASFVLPLGASMNMDGMSIYLGCATIFFAQAFGVDLQFHDYIVLIITATVGSIGGAGIPGSSMIMLPLVLASTNVPIEGMALIAGIDRIGDMVRTTINITGDAMVTLLIDKSEGKLNTKVYFADN